MLFQRSTLALLGAALAPWAASALCNSVSFHVNTPPVVARGRSLAYKLTITNHGPSTLSNYEVIINTPAMATVTKMGGASKRADATIQQQQDAYGNVWQVPSLAAGKSKTLTLRLAVDKCAPDILTVGALGRASGTLACSTGAPDAVVQVKGANSKCDNAVPTVPSGFSSFQQIASLYDAYPQGDTVASSSATGIGCTGKYALCAFATCRIVSVDTNPPLAECGCYGYQQPTGEDAQSLLAQSLLLSASAKVENSACATSPESCQTTNAAPICPKLNEPQPDIYDKKFDIISTYDLYTWPNSSTSPFMPTNSFCTQGQYTNCCTAGCVNRRSWNGFNTTCYCPVYDVKDSDQNLFYVGEGSCTATRGMTVGSIVHNGMGFLNF